MRKLVLLLVGVIAAPFVGVKANASEKKLARTINLAKSIVGDKTTVEIKPLDQMKLAQQDHTGPGKPHNS